MLKRILFGSDAGMTRREFKKMTERSSLSDFLPWDAFDAPTGMYVNADDTFGFIW